MAAKQEEHVEEDATELRFGKGTSTLVRGVRRTISSVDFDNADALLISEVKMLLEHRKAQHESQDDDQELSEVRVTGNGSVRNLPCTPRCSPRHSTIARPSANTIAERPLVL